jgi:hypothetical protein
MARPSSPTPTAANFGRSREGYDFSAPEDAAAHHNDAMLETAVAAEVLINWRRLNDH